jgi:hypothetical protein
MPSWLAGLQEHDATHAWMLHHNDKTVTLQVQEVKVSPSVHYMHIFQTDQFKNYDFVFIGLTLIIKLNLLRTDHFGFIHANTNNIKYIDMNARSCRIYNLRVDMCRDKSCIWTNLLQIQSYQKETNHANMCTLWTSNYFETSSNYSYQIWGGRGLVVRIAAPKSSYAAPDLWSLANPGWRRTQATFSATVATTMKPACCCCAPGHGPGGLRRSVVTYLNY